MLNKFILPVFCIPSKEENALTFCCPSCCFNCCCCCWIVLRGSCGRLSSVVFVALSMTGDMR